MSVWCRVGWVLLLAAATAGCGTRGGPAPGGEGHEEGAGDEAAVAVRAVPAKRGTLVESAEALGRCEALPDHLATLTPAVEGHVHRLLVKEGQEVKKGQPIVELDETVVRADLAEKTAARDGLKASLALLKSLPRPEENRAHELAVETAKVQVAQAQATVDRLRPLMAAHEVSEQTFFDAQKALEHAQLARQTAEAQLRVTLIGPRAEAVAEAEGKIKTAEAQLALSQAHLDYHTIRAPIDGVLESLSCHPGQTIAVGTAIGEVVDTREVFAAVWLPARAAVRVKVGQAARVLPATSDDRETSAENQEPRATEAAQEKHEPGADEAKGKPEPKPEEGVEKGMDGTVAFVGRIADPQTGNIPVRVRVANPGSLLTVGETLRVTVRLAEHKDVLQVPSAAVLDLGEGPVLNVVRDGKNAVLHPETGVARGGWVEVKGTDLKEGEPVIVEGGYNLPEKTAVKVAGEEDEREHAEGHEGEKAAGKAEPAAGAGHEAEK